MKGAAARRARNPSFHGARYVSEGFTREGRHRQAEARRTGLCASCGARFRPDTSKPNARWSCGPGCSDRFYEDHFRAWRPAERGAVRRNREAHGGNVTCELCGAQPRPIHRALNPLELEIYLNRNARLGYTREEAEAILAPAVHRGFEVDHKREIAAGGDPFDPRNLWVLCLKCHRRKTRRFLGGGGARRARLRGKVPSTPATLPRLEAFG